MRLATASLIVLLTASAAAAQEPQPQAPQEGAQREHVVKKGDTLWDLAGFYLSNPFSWPAIYQANPLVVEDPHWIYPQEVLVIPGLSGVAPLGATAPADAAPGVASRPAARRSARTVFYREPVRTSQDQDPTLLSEPRLQDMPVRPGQFHSAEFLAAPDQLVVAGRMIRTLRNVGDMNDEPTTAHPRDVVFLSYSDLVQPRVGDRLVMVRPGRLVSEAGAETRIIHPTAVVQVEALNQEVMEARVLEQFGPVDTGQRALPIQLFPDFLAPEAEPVDGPDVTGEVFEFVTEQDLYGRADRAFINLGRNQGVGVGDVFIAFLPEREAGEGTSGEYALWNQQMPVEAAAELIVVRADENTSTVQVQQLLLPVLEDGIMVRRIRKMP